MMLNTTTTQNATAAYDLKLAWRDLLADHPHLRPRDAASALGVSEAELVATGCGDNAIRLRPDWPALIDAVGTLGPVMALTRNDVAVHEKTGLYEHLRLCGELLLVSGHNIELCLLTGRWHSGYATTEQSRIGPRRSLQFFDADGEAVHKIYLTEHSDAERFRRLAEAFAAADQTPSADIPYAEPAGFDWAAAQGLPDLWQRLAPLCTGKPLAAAGFVSGHQFRELMQQLARMALPLQILTANAGALQLHTGPVQNLRITDPWFNVLDQGFNLHLNEKGVAEAAIVHTRHDRHTLRGLQLRDRLGQTVAAVFGDYDPADGESLLWREFIDALPGNRIFN
ncbi:ChuX/HutX family heme-like substrate-binding protein [Methylomonas koyamae]|uniref:Haemin-degrading HemS/ChuX domain-containing protein n=1 Tax=Methylomonas koyamae TaxID=702114 RepID=A0AA91DER6_9GAMM|nr:ChuX/HutX family heme-like substrate-binding protein [Methylomonas koyamae]OAI28561.1 hypothetical protein A1356_06780 [Methylomonas koyamae]